MVQAIMTPDSQTGLLSGRLILNGDVRKKGPKKQGNVQLRKNLGLMDGVAIIIGTIVGSGIFISPKGVLEATGSIGSALVVWVLCGLLSMIGAMCYAELGTSIPRSGGDYAYINEAFGSLPSFLYLWCANVVFVPSTNAIMGITFANYVIQPLYPNCAPPNNAVRLLAASVIWLLTFLNCYNVKWTTKMQDFLMFFKIAALLIIIIAGLIQFGMGEITNFEHAFEGSRTSPGFLALSFYSGIYSYAGWNYLNFVTEELKNPYKTLPRAIAISLPMVTLVYVLANVSYFTVLTREEVLESSAVAVTFANKILGVMRWLVPFLVAGCTFGGLSVHIFTSARLCFVGARQGHFPDSLALISIRYLTPIPALIFLGTLSTLMLSITDVYILINYSSFVESMFVLWSVAGLLWLRWRRPELSRPIKVHLFFPIFFLFICTFLVCLPVYVSPMAVGLGLCIMLTGIPVYLVGIFWEDKPKWFQDKIRSLTINVQKFLLAVQQENELD